MARQDDPGGYALLLVTWFGATAVKAMIWFYTLTVVSAQWLGLRSHRSLSLPLAVATAALAIMLHRSAADVRAFIRFSWTPYSAVFEVILPLGLWALAACSGRRSTQEAKLERQTA